MKMRTTRKKCTTILTRNQSQNQFSTKRRITNLNKLSMVTKGGIVTREDGHAIDPFAVTIGVDLWSLDVKGVSRHKCWNMSRQLVQLEGTQIAQCAHCAVGHLGPCVHTFVHTRCLPVSRIHLILSKVVIWKIMSHFNTQGLWWLRLPLLKKKHSQDVQKMW